MRLCEAEGGQPRQKMESTIDEGAADPGYMDRCGAEAGHLVIFDRENGR